MSERADHGRLPHIGYVGGTYPRATDTFVQREVVGLRGRGLAVSTISVRRADPKTLTSDEQRGEASRTESVLPLRPLRTLAAHGGMLTRSPARYARAVRAAVRLCRPGVRGWLYQMIYFLEAGVVASWAVTRGVTHLHCHFPDSTGTVTAIASVMSGRSTSLHIHGPDVWTDTGPWKLAEKLALARFAVCIGHYARSQAMLHTAVDRWADLEIVRCGVGPIEPFETLRPQRERATRLIFVGRLAPAKGLPVLMRAFETLAGTRPDMRLDIVGDGPSRAELASWRDTRGLSDRVVLHGAQSPARVRELLGESDVFVMTSLAEGVPVVLMEAMAAGVPVIAPRIAGVGELVEHGVSGVLVHPGDARLAAEAFEAIADDRARREALARAAHARVLQWYNADTELDRLAALFRTRATAGDVGGGR